MAGHQPINKPKQNKEITSNKPQANDQTPLDPTPFFQPGLLHRAFKNPESASAKTILQLQPLVGNRAISQRLAATSNHQSSGHPIQTRPVRPQNEITGTRLSFNSAGGLVVQRAIQNQDNIKRLIQYIKEKNKALKLDLDWSRMKVILSAVIQAFDDDQIDAAEREIDQRLYEITLANTQPKPAQHKPAQELLGISLGELDSYAQQQADWHIHPSLSGREGESAQHRLLLRKLLAFAREGEGHILAACTRLNISVLKQKCFTLGENTANLKADKLKHLRAYSEAASAAGVPLKLTPTDDIDLALKWGETLSTLQNWIPKGMLNRSMKNMKEDTFKSLIEHALVDDLIQYYIICNPIFQAPGGNDIKAYIQLRIDDNVNPLDFMFVPHLRNLHRFHGSVLQKLKTNWEEGNKEQKPLTLVLHSSLDHAGSLCRQPGLKEIFDRTDIFVLMIEGATSLQAVSSLIGPLAQKFGKDGQIDQVLSVGHGGARSMELAGDYQEGIDTIASQALDLDREAQATNDLFDQLLIHVGSTQPRRRILFNACLTNSNEVPRKVPLDKDNYQRAREQVRAYIKIHASLATHLQNSAKEKEAKVTVVGANASIKQVQLMNPKTGELDLISNEALIMQYYNLVKITGSQEAAQAWATSAADPYVTAPKVDYVKYGKEPKGALRAVFEAYWHDGQEKETIEAMQWRCQNYQQNSWSDVIIQSVYSYLLSLKVPHHLVLRPLIDMAGTIDGVRKKPTCRVNHLDSQWFEKLGGVIINDMFPKLVKTQDWTEFNHAPLVVYQVWMKHDPSKAAALIQHLGQHFNCKTAAEFIDFEYLAGQNLLPDLLTGQSKGNFLIALLGVQKSDQGQKLLCSNFLNQFTDPPQVGNAFHQNQKPLLQELLQGYAGEKSILINMGREFAGAASVEANVKGVGQQNTVYVESITKSGMVSSVSGAPVYASPNINSPTLGPPIGQNTEVVIFGQKSFGENNKWYAIEYSPLGSQQVSTAFIKQDDVQLN